MSLGCTGAQIFVASITSWRPARFFMAVELLWAAGAGVALAPVLTGAAVGEA